MVKHTIIQNIPKIKIPTQVIFFLIAGPCVIEDALMPFEIAEVLVTLTSKLHIPFIFKASYRKANRTKADSLAVSVIKKVWRF